MTTTSKSYHQPVFAGNASEYFRIWIVNMLLSLLTFGIWSPWATVRNRRYLYGNTKFAGNHFDFHGNPWAILRGRILAVALFIAYAVGGDFYVEIPVAAVLLLVLLYPWMLASALRFRLSNTSWRNLRFGFSASFKQAYAQLGLPVIMIMLTLGWFLLVKIQVSVNQTYLESTKWNGLAILVLLLLSLVLLPLAFSRIRRLTLNSAQLGDHGFSAEIRFTRFLGLYVLSLLVLIAAVLVMVCTFIFMGTVTGGAWEVLVATSKGEGYWIVAILYIVITLCYLMPFAFWNVTTANYVFSATRMEDLEVDMDMDVWVYWWIFWTNALVAVVTLGLAIPWTKIRMLKYKLSCLKVHGELKTYYGHNVANQTATGDEIGDAFDIDFGF